MPKVSLKNKKERELLEYIDSDHVNRTFFSLSERKISIFFVNDHRVDLYFNSDYRFEKLLLSRSNLDDFTSKGIWFRDSTEDRNVLAFIYNLLNRDKSDSFIFYCERLVMEFWRNQSG